MHKRRTFTMALCALTALPVLTGIAIAQTSAADPEFPNRPVHIIVPGLQGSSLDTSGRELANHLQHAWGVPVVVEYKPGAGSSVGASFVARSKPDGYTWLIAPYNVLTLNPHLYKTKEHPLDEFAPVSMIANVPFVLAVHPSVPVNSVRELIDYARANPGKLNYGTSGVGSAQHLGGALFNSLANVELTEVGYKKGSEAILDLLAGRIQVYFGANNSLLQHIGAGSLRALAVAGAKRSQATAELPTVAESGVPGYQLPTWNAVVVPAGVPESILEKIHEGVVQTLNNPEVKARLANQGIEVQTTSPDELTRLIRQEYDELGKLVSGLER